MKKLKSILVYLWNKTIDIKISLSNKIVIAKDTIEKKLVSSPNIKTIDETIEDIVSKKMSVSRFGDGEFKLANGIDISFQKSSEILKERLREILALADEEFMVCLPDIFDDLNKYSDEPRDYWRLHIARYRNKWYKLLNKNRCYGNSFISRCYYQFKDKSKSEKYFNMMRNIWDDREIVLIEGRKSRLGIGNDLFNNVKSIERILIPEVNAFDKYESILEKVSVINKSKLILLAAGPTATVLAYDLYKQGYQAIDIGHIDIEYEWFLRKAAKKISIDNKFVCEAGFGEGVGELNDQEYKKQIIAIV